MNNILKALIIAVIATTITMLFITLSLSDENKEVDCFDKYGNKIIGVKCINYSEPFGITDTILTSILIFISFSVTIYLFLEMFSGGGYP